MRLPLPRPILAAVLAGVTLSSAEPARAQEAGQVKTAINAYRAANGRTTLAVNPALDRAAQAYARFLADRDRTTAADWHGVDGRTPQQRAAAAGYTGPIWENVQLNWGYSDPAAKAVEWWIGSPPHNANMLNPGHTVMGVGAARSASGKWFFVVMFGQAAGGGGEARTVRVSIQNRTDHVVTFQIEGRSHTLRPGQYGTYSHTKVGDVKLSYSWSDGAIGAGERRPLVDGTRYAFVPSGRAGHYLTTVGRF